MTTHSSSGAAYVVRGALASPLTRVLLIIAGIIVLAIVGRAAGAGTGPPPPASTEVTDAGESANAPVALAPAPSPTELPQPAPCSSLPRRGRAGDGERAASEATPDDPVVLNTATAVDLRRLPGVGAKRAEAILALRTRLGRFRQLEDLLRVRGVGRASLRRLRPLVRIDPKPEATAPASRGESASPPPP